MQFHINKMGWGGMMHKSPPAKRMTSAGKSRIMGYQDPCDEQLVTSLVHVKSQIFRSFSLTKERAHHSCRLASLVILNILRGFFSLMMGLMCIYDGSLQTHWHSVLLFFFFFLTNSSQENISYHWEN